MLSPRQRFTVLLIYLYRRAINAGYDIFSPINIYIDAEESIMSTCEGMSDEDIRELSDTELYELYDLVVDAFREGTQYKLLDSILQST